MKATVPVEQVSPHDVALDLAALLLYVLKASARDFFQAMAEIDLSFTQVITLNLLDVEDRELSIKELADHLAISLPTASRVVDCLHRRGLVERREDERDRRIRQVRITPAGRRIPGVVQGARIAALSTFATTLSDEERGALAGALAPLLARAEVGACRASGADDD